MILAPKDPVQKEQLRQAVIYRNVSNVTKNRWWYVPLALIALLLLGKTTSLLLRPAASQEAGKAVNENDTVAAHNREMDKLDKLIELERLRRLRPPEFGMKLDHEPQPPGCSVITVDAHPESLAAHDIDGEFHQGDTPHTL